MTRRTATTPDTHNPTPRSDPPPCTPATPGPTHPNTKTPGQPVSPTASTPWGMHRTHSSHLKPPDQPVCAKLVTPHENPPPPGIVESPKAKPPAHQPPPPRPAPDTLYSVRKAKSAGQRIYWWSGGVRGGPGHSTRVSRLLRRALGGSCQSLPSTWPRGGWRRSRGAETRHRGLPKPVTSDRSAGAPESGWVPPRWDHGEWCVGRHPTAIVTDSSPPTPKWCRPATKAVVCGD